MSRAHGHIPPSISPGKLTKDDIMETFKDVHTGLGTLGSPLHITLNPNVTPIQAHPHRYPLATEAKAAEAICDLEKQGILKMLQSQPRGSPTVSMLWFNFSSGSIFFKPVYFFQTGLFF